MDARAWLEWNGTLFWTSYLRSPFEPYSALLALVDGIWDRFPGSAHFMLRSRIFINYEPTEICRGVTVVCAKRMSRLSAVPGDLLARMQSGEGSVQISKPKGLLSQGFEEGNRITQILSLPERDRSIECWLVSDEGRLLACSLNTAGRNRTRHAEMNLLRHWWVREKRPLPVGARLISTLEPCPMCAGAIWESLEDKKKFKVEFVRRDLGPMVRRSVLRDHPLLSQCLNFEHSNFS